MLKKFPNTIYWMDKNTLCLCSDYDVDENGDEYFYLCEYHIDTDSYIFQKVYEYCTLEADFTEEQKKLIKKMIEIIKETEEK